MWAAYEKALEKDPLLIKGLTSMTGFAIGDILAQQFIEKKGKYNLNRTIKMASFGLLVHGTTSHWFYGKLDGKIPGTDAGAVASKVFIDQVLWNPIFGHVLRLHGSLERQGVDGTIKRIKGDLMTQVTGSWTVWPVRAINFKFIPTESACCTSTIRIFACSSRSSTATARRRAASDFPGVQAHPLLMPLSLVEGPRVEHVRRFLWRARGVCAFVGGTSPMDAISRRRVDGGAARAAPRAPPRAPQTAATR